jgi:cell division protein FtsL
MVAISPEQVLTGHRRRAATPPRPSRSLPAALEWRDVRLPVLGNIRASAWLPTILLAACAVALVYLVQTSGVATTGYDIQRLQAERSEWQLRNEQLKLELAKLRSLTWVQSEAVGRMGMVKPDADKLMYLRVQRRAVAQ